MQLVISMRISIIVPYFHNEDTILNLLRSLDDQDFKDFHVYIVIDGEDHAAFANISDELAPKFNFPIDTLMSKDHIGAAAARNAGAMRSKQPECGDNAEILFFLDADCKVLPGMLREVIHQFEENPDIDFIYSGYRRENDTIAPFESGPFDPYLLQTMNYISTMSPVRRSAFEWVNGFDESLEYFQDWDLFFRLSESGHKGKFIKDYIFETKASGESNISGTKGLTLSDKAAKFRKNNQIEDKPICVTTFSAPLQSIQRAKMLGADYVGPVPGSMRELFPCNLMFDSWKALYLVGMFNDPIEAVNNHFGIIPANYRRIIHWIGTDVWQLLNCHSFKQIELIANALKKSNAVMFANSKTLSNELSQVGIFAETLHSPIFEPEKYSCVAPPDDFTVAVYYSDTANLNAWDGAGGRSNIPFILDVARSMPTIKFKFFGGMAKGISDNIEQVGRIPSDKMPEFIGSCSMILRSTIHDGFPQLPIQFLFSGRRALVSCPDEDLRFTDKLSFEDIYDYDKCKQEVMDKIAKIRDEEKSATIEKCRTLSDVSRQHYLKLMDESKYKARIFSEIEGK